MHIDNAVVAGGIGSRQQNRVGVAYEANVAQAFGLVRLRKRQITLEVIGRNRRGRLP